MASNWKICVIYKEKDGSLTINCNQGEITMSTRNFGMVGKAYRTASEAFKDADYANPIEMPEKAENGYLGAIFVCLISVAFVVGLFIRF